MRTIPADTQRGWTVEVSMTAVRIGGKTFRLAPGARLFNAQNLMITPNQLPPDVLVRYQLDGTGQLRALWILTEAEANRR